MSKRDLKNFGSKLKATREYQDLSQAKLAELVGLSSNFIGMVERGQRNTTVEKIYILARALKVSPTIFFE